MDLSNVSMRSSSAAPQVVAARGESSAFAGVLSAQKEKYQEAKTAAEQLMATTFVAPLLKRVRESNNAAAPFAPTSAEKSLRSLADATLADNIVRKSNWPLVEQLAQRMLSKSGQSVVMNTAASKDGI